MKSVGIVGGGIIGLCTAYFLHKEGHEVTVIEKSNFTKGASFVNAGYITPSHIIPLASPGMIKQGIKYMFNSASPFYMQPRLDMDFLKWSWYFHKSSTHEKVAKAIPIIKDINLLSQELYEGILASGDLGTFQLERKGLLMLYKTDAAYKHEKAVADKASFLGLEVSELDKAGIEKIEPNVTINANGAIHYECDGHMTPTEFMPKMLAYLKKVGVVVKSNEEVLDLQVDTKRITAIKTDKHNYTFDEIVIATGGWSGEFLKKLNLKLPLQPGKGYRINVARPTQIGIPAILMEAKMAVTPMLGFTRFAGTMEFSGINTRVRKERVEAIANGAQKFYPDLQITESEKAAAQTGMRPVSPDGLPFIGRCNHFKNLTIATGHAMMGWSLGPATGQLITDIISERKTAMSLTGMEPGRKF